MRRLLIAVLLAICTPDFALAWGELGHRTVAEVASRSLSEPAAGAIARLLGPERFVDVATWADDYREINPETDSWHVVNIPGWADVYLRARDCAADQCVIEKIREFKATLADTSALPATRMIALKFLIHLVGDIHTPFHALDPFSRRGGVWARVGDTVESLHLLWDNDFVDALGSDEGALADMLEIMFSAERSEWAQGTPEDWANESFVIARQFIRAHDVPAKMRANAATQERPIELGRAVIDDAKPIVARRLYLAGLRLGRLLNEAFDRGRAATSLTRSRCTRSRCRRRPATSPP